MRTTNKQKEVTWEGTLEVINGHMAVLVTLPSGGSLAIGAGKLVPEDWIGKKVSVVSRIIEDHEIN